MVNRRAIQRNSKLFSLVAGASYLLTTVPGDFRDARVAVAPVQGGAVVGIGGAL